MHKVLISSPQLAVYAQVLIVVVRIKTGERVGAQKALKTLTLCTAARHPVALVNDNPRNAATLLEQLSEHSKEFVVGVVMVTHANDRLRNGKDVRIYDRRERAIAAHPLVWRVGNTWCLKLCAGSVVKIVSDVFLVGQQFMNGSSAPRLTEFVADSFAVKNGRDLGFGPFLMCESLVNPSHYREFLLGTGSEDHAFSLKALPLASSKGCLRISILVKQQPTQPVSSHAALTIAQRDEMTLAGEHFRAELPAVFAGHRAFEALDDSTHRSGVIRKMFCAVLD